MTAFIPGVISLKNVVARMIRWRLERRTYAELKSLDDRMLADIGISRGEIRSVATHGRQGHEVAGYGV
ncbi:MAG: DUF1127 domain-containing protein [Tistrella sp.]|jgi:uncharacterized protein YjiS (DUF1127 family)|uniref:YjiS-like domain-containing protein n=2 Tax=Tistrella mobilis TaxID=171437 RepID=I3TX84_TISMK|nr:MULTISPECIES: DUF1127 domain-containing protein [Tistrella]AFK57372.1 hypothetical protein TMO_c0762 [Tistrella mobilis KA081020-065]KYO50837.1 hypothetical protein AUP44_01265 [Tistrella mobilis]MAD39085.1 DUF1127 domain-containing protein [Tistrella sp.]MAM72953.1 DUF1127 domain-containing protein [Tistrella sp.]MBA74684.1 DUF1127 domain-containing protein [Tistrella sp.]|tara:strand:- start:390 stop:593 length:204 start_codon:yes stop_codon:yes gene_type:complete